MESLFLSIQKQLADNLPELSLIDEDYGQLNLESAEDTYPVTFPCALINVGETAWKSLAGKSQSGTAEVTIKLAIDCYDDTHYTADMSPELQQLFLEKAVNRMQMARKLHLCLQNFKPVLPELIAPFDAQIKPLQRTSSATYSMPHRIKVYQFTYSASMFDFVQ